MISFIIPYPNNKKVRTSWNKEYGLNAYYQGKFWAKRNQDAQFWHSMVREELRKQKILKNPVDYPVKITMYFNSNLDLSNNASIFKLIEDGMKGWIIHDDNKKYVRGIEYRIHDKDYILVEVTKYTAYRFVPLIT